MTNLQPKYPAFISQIWSGKINAGLDKSCVLLQCVNRDYQADADKGAEAINIVTPGKVSAGVYNGSIASYETVSSEPVKLELSQSVYFGFQVPDIDEAQSNVGIVDNLTVQAKKSIEQAIDRYLFGMYEQTAAENQLGSTSAPEELDKTNVYAKFVALAKSLKLSGALTAANQGWVVVHPDVEELLLLSEQLIAPSNAGDKAIETGAIGKIAGLDVYVTNNAGKIAGGKYVVMAGTKDAITYASQLSKVETIRAQGSFDSIVRGLYTYGAHVLNPSAIATLTCEL
jgi:hypothetical protein